VYICKANKKKALMQDCWS